MTTRTEIKAQLLSAFILDIEDDPSTIRYVFMGFRKSFLTQLTKTLSAEGKLSIDFIDASTHYREVIERRATDEPAILHVSKSRAGEFASLLTFKTFVNEFELPYDRTLSQTARTYTLYDVTSWLLENEHLEEFIKKVTPETKERTLSNIVVFLKTVWQYAEQNVPGLKYALSPDALIAALQETQKSNKFDLNLVAETLGFDPSLKLLEPGDVEKATHSFLIRSDRVRRRLLKGTFLERRRTLGRMTENLVRGILVLLCRDRSISRSVGIDKPEELIETFEEMDKRKRVHGVVPRNIRIGEYSKYSGMPKSVEFGIQVKAKDKYVTSRFSPSTWNDILKQFAKSEGMGEQPISFKVNGDKVIATYRYLEGYDFALKAWKREEL